MHTNIALLKKFKDDKNHTGILKSLLSKQMYILIPLIDALADNKNEQMARRRS